MIFALLRTVIFLVFLGVAQEPVAAMVPRTVVCPDISDGLFSSPREGRHLSCKFAFDASDEAYLDAASFLGVFRRFDLNHLAKCADIYSQEYSTPERPGSAYTPTMLQLIPAWQGKPIVFDTLSSIRTQRVLLAYSDSLSIADFSRYFAPLSLRNRLLEGGRVCFGASFPLIKSQSTNRYELNKFIEGTPAELMADLPAADEKAERLRVELFDKIGLAGNVWDYSGVGDLHVYAGVHTHAEYLLRLRTFDGNILLGALLPSGMHRDSKFPSSLPFSISTVGITMQTHLDFGLKDYMHVGLMAGLLIGRAKDQEMRLPVYQEPAAYSPLVMTTRLEPGLTYWLNPYLKINNIANNVHFTANYAYVVHGQDSFPKDKNSEIPLVASLITRAVGDANPYGITNDVRDHAYNNFVAQTAWRTRHFGVALTYEPYQADKNVRLNPLLTVGCQISHRGMNVPKMYHVFVNASLQF